MMEVSREEFEDVAKSVKRMELALLGDEDLKIKGMAQKVDEHDTYIATLERWKNKGLGMLTVFSLVGIGAYELLKFAIHKLF